MSKLEDRLQTHLTRVTATSPAAGFESRVLAKKVAHQTPLPKSPWAAQAVTVGAMIAVGVAVLIGLRAFHQGPAVKSKTTPKPPAATSPIPATSLYVIQMFNSNAGWALTDQGLFRTSDDWAHWIKAGPAGVALGGRDTTDFLSETTAWVATIDVNDPHVVTVLRTDDAGLTWQQSSITDPNSAGPAQLDFIDALHGWLLVGYGAAASNEGP